MTRRSTSLILAALLVVAVATAAYLARDAGPARQPAANAGAARQAASDAARPTTAAASAPAATVPVGDRSAFAPPAESAIPNDEFGTVVRQGRDIFVNTGTLARQYVGNSLSCVNCHLDAGRLANSSPMWAAWVAYPKYRTKDHKVNTMADRIAGCFTFSMNGTPPPPDSDVMRALQTYFFWLATGAPTGQPPPGGGYPHMAKPAQPPDATRGAQLYTARCALCHGDDGAGRPAPDGTVVFPPLWGQRSFNGGAGMHRVETAASFIKHNMPLGLPGTLSDQEAWDVAAFVNSHPRPPDPRTLTKAQ